MGNLGDGVYTEQFHKQKHTGALGTVYFLFNITVSVATHVRYFVSTGYDNLQFFQKLHHNVSMYY